MGFLVIPHGIRRDGVGRECKLLQVRPRLAAVQVEAGRRRHRHGRAERRLAARDLVLRHEHVELRERTLHRHVVLVRAGRHVNGRIEGVLRRVVGLQLALEGKRGHVAVGEIHVIGTVVHGEEDHLIVLALGQGQDDVDVLAAHRLHGLEARAADLRRGDQGAILLGERGRVELELAGRVVKVRTHRSRLRQDIPEIDGEGYGDRLAAPGGIRRTHRLLDAGSQGEGRDGGKHGKD